RTAKHPPRQIASRVSAPPPRRGGDHKKKEDIMKRHLFTVLSGIATLVVLGIAQNLLAEDAHPCSQHGVAGLWGFSLTGNLDGTPALAAGTLTIDRYGNLTGGGTFNIGGSVSDEVFTGTVTVNSDCSGHLSLPQYPI